MIRRRITTNKDAIRLLMSIYIHCAASLPFHEERLPSYDSSFLVTQCAHATNSCAGAKELFERLRGAAIAKRAGPLYPITRGQKK